MRRTIEIEALRRAVDYDRETGLFTWRVRPLSDFSSSGIHKNWNAKHSGKPAFTTRNADGYLHSRINGVRLSAHRAAFAFVYGYWPEGMVDHINGDIRDTRISNLREANSATNGQNSRKRPDNSSGTTGVSISRGAYRAEICAFGNRVNLGQFRTLEDAVAARKKAERDMGFSENHGRAALSPVEGAKT